MPAWAQVHRKPECLPEQLLCSALGEPPFRANATVAGGLEGQCAPHSSADGSSPAFASIALASSVCAGSPECEAQASASSRCPKPQASAAPLSTKGSAWIAFTA